MIPEFDPTQIVACALRPAGSWMHFGVLVGFVVLAWFLAPSRDGASRPASSGRARSASLRSTR